MRVVLNSVNICMMRYNMDSEGLEKNIGSTHETLSVSNHLLG